MDVTGALLRVLGDRLQSAAWLASGHSTDDGSSVAAFDSFTPPVFLLQFATPALPGPALTTPYSALSETVRKRFGRLSFISRRAAGLCQGALRKNFLRTIEVYSLEGEAT